MSQAAPTAYVPWKCRHVDPTGRRCREVLGRIERGMLHLDGQRVVVDVTGTLAVVCPVCQCPNLWTPGTANLAPGVH